MKKIELGCNGGAISYKVILILLMCILVLFVKYSESVSISKTIAKRNEELMSERTTVVVTSKIRDITVETSTSSEFANRVRDFSQINLVAALTDVYGIDLDIILSIIYVESGYKEKVVSPKGAIGLMQVMPENFGPDSDRTDPVHNVFAGVSVYSRLYNLIYKDFPEPERTKMSVASYNCGMDLRRFKNFESAKQHVPEETRNYVTKVMKFREKSVEVVKVEE